jgi:hypothetical protein
MDAKSRTAETSEALNFGLPAPIADAVKRFMTPSAHHSRSRHAAAPPVPRAERKHFC